MSDNGGEYTSKEVRELMQRCWDQDPQQNGVAERKNRTMLEAMKIKIFLCVYGQKQK